MNNLRKNALQYYYLLPFFFFWWFLLFLSLSSLAVQNQHTPNGLHLHPDFVTSSPLASGSTHCISLNSPGRLTTYVCSLWIQLRQPGPSRLPRLLNYRKAELLDLQLLQNKGTRLWQDCEYLDVNAMLHTIGCQVSSTLGRPGQDALPSQ